MLLLSDDWGDIEGPSSPPKPALGSVQAAAAAAATAAAAAEASNEAAAAVAAAEQERIAKDTRENQSSHSDVTVRNTPGPTTIDSQSEKIVASDVEPQFAVNAVTVSGGQVVHVEQTETAFLPASLQNHPETAQPVPVKIGTTGKTTIHSDSKIVVKKPADSDEVNLNEVPVLEASQSPESAVCELEGSGSTAVESSSVMKPISVETELKTRDKGDLVVVGGSERTTPSSDSNSTTNKGRGFCISS